MAIKFFDRIKDTSETNGTGNITVSGTAAEGFRTFSTVLSGGDQFYYAITGVNGEWETGTGTMVSNNTFSRVLDESSTGALVDFTTGTKQVFLSVNSDYFNTIPTVYATQSDVQTVLDLLAPAKPANLSAATIQINSTYSAKESSTGTPRSNIINSTTPTILLSSAVTAFYNGDSGTLTAYIDGVDSGNRTLTTANDTGTYTSLRILSDADPYVGQFGKQNFWKQLTATIVPASALALKVSHTAQLTHSATGSTNLLTFYCDNPGTPTITSQSVTGVTHTSGKRLSGIPCLSTGDTIQAQCTANNVTNSFYNSSQIVRFSGSQISNLDYNPGSTPVSGASIATGIQNLVVSGSYSAAATITCTAYNSKGDQGSANITIPSIRICVPIVETGRKTSGTGDWPASGYGSAYDSNQLLTANSELQLDIDGLYKYPPATNYTTVLPAGPNYSTGLGAADRYVTFNLGTVTDITSKILNFTGQQNFGATAIITGFKMWIRVDGASPTNGWVDGNVAYASGSPMNNGDAALVVASSTQTIRYITFGTIPKTGNFFVRIALPSGSTKLFTGIS